MQLFNITQKTFFFSSKDNIPALWQATKKTTLSCYLFSYIPFSGYNYGKKICVMFFYCRLPCYWCSCNYVYISFCIRNNYCSLTYHSEECFTYQWLLSVMWCFSNRIILIVKKRHGRFCKDGKIWNLFFFVWQSS